ncbi:MAG: UbiA family prenyltransferase [Gemmataceae bacterium]|nr:UbiA family prenyltransferase [Gemmataceae bacterium]
MNGLIRLVRLPALPSALADVCLGALASGALPGNGIWFAVLLAGSACLYLGGMALNDWFDQEDDRKHRPERPIPSGEIASGRAALVGFGLLGIGTVLAALVSPVWACVLAGLILLYDGYAKSTPLGPLAMGACRAAHVMLALSLGGDPWRQPGPHLALATGLYIVGVTWFARREEKQGSRGELQGAALVVLAALVLALAAPVHRPENTASPLFPYLLVALGFFVGLPMKKAMDDPRPSNVQAAVKRLLMGLIGLDAVLAMATAGIAGAAILLLMLPSLALGRLRRLSAT